MTRSISSNGTRLPLLTVILLLASRPLFAEPLGFPALSVAIPPEHLQGKVVWADLVTPNLAGAQAFYTGLFGWVMHDIQVGNTDYAVALVDDRPIAGLLQRTIPPGQQQQSHWLTFLAVRNADAAVRTAATDGAKILSKPTTYGNRGRQAVLAGPDGAIFAVLASTSGDPGDFLAAPGEWIWSTLLTQDPDGAAKFYQSVFGYDAFDLPRENGMQHVILSAQDYARAGIISLPKDTHHRHAHWLNFIRVDDAAATSAKAVSLGGKILVAPRLDRHGGHIALLADPYGAPFGVMEWTAADSQTAPK